MEETALTRREDARAAAEKERGGTGGMEGVVNRRSGGRPRGRAGGTGRVARRGVPSRGTRAM